MSIEDKKLSDEWRTPDDLFNVLDKAGIYQGIKFKGFNFDIDLCATKENSKCDVFYIDYLKNLYSHKEYQLKNKKLGFTDGAKCNTKGAVNALMNNPTCFMNPPYSNPKPFIEKAWHDSQWCKIVCLVKCDPSTQWWATFWDYNSKQKIDMVKCNACNGCGKYTWWQGTVGYEEDPCDVCGGSKTKSEKIIIPPGPKPGCEVLFFPKRIKFDPPQQLIDSGEVWQVKSGERKDTPELNKAGFAVYNNKWVQKCKECYMGKIKKYPNSIFYTEKCSKCKGKGYTPLSGPAFSCALLIFDRRNV